MTMFNVHFSEFPPPAPIHCCKGERQSSTKIRSVEPPGNPFPFQLFQWPEFYRYPETGNCNVVEEEQANIFHYSTYFYSLTSSKYWLLSLPSFQLDTLPYSISTIFLPFGTNNILLEGRGVETRFMIPSLFNNLGFNNLTQPACGYFQVYLLCVSVSICQ